MSWRDKVKNARLPELTVKLVMRGDLQVEHERLVAEIEQAKEKKADSLAGKGTAALEKRLREIEAEADGSVVEFRLRGLPRSKRAGDVRPTWVELSEGHPPRVEDGIMDARDRLMGGQNMDTFPEPFVRASIVAIDGDESPLTDGDWAELMGSITDYQFDQLVNGAWELNQREVSVPFWSGGSKPTPTTSPG
jgi:hypothetical protein